VSVAYLGQWHFRKKAEISAKKEILLSKGKISISQ